MKRVDINLAAAPFRNDAPWWTLLAALAAVAALFTAANVWALASARSRGAALEAEMAGHRARMTKMAGEAAAISARLSKVDQKHLLAQAAFVDGVLGRRDFSWTRLFDALEETIPWNVRLVAVRPTTQKGVVWIDIDGEARTPDALFALEQALLDSPRFGRIEPSGFDRRTGEDKLTFRLRARYVPEGAPPPGDETPAAAPRPAPAPRAKEGR